MHSMGRKEPFVATAGARSTSNSTTAASGPSASCREGLNQAVVAGPTTRHPFATSGPVMGSAAGVSGRMAFASGI